MSSFAPIGADGIGNYAAVGGHGAPAPSRIAPEDDIALPPNVREYLRKVRFYRESGIVPGVDPAREFSITSTDRELIARVSSSRGRIRVASETRTSATDTGRNWREQMSSAPLKYRSQDWEAIGSAPSARQASVSQPGITFSGGSINGRAIDSDSHLRGNYTARAQDHKQTQMDTCQKRAYPDYRGGEVKASLNTAFYQAIPYRGLGAGMGNIEVNNHIQFGETTRIYTDKKVAGSAIDRFEPLLRDDFQQPDHVVLPFPRGGIDTRSFDRYSRQDGVKRL
jgi:hypothetical protein